MSQKKCNFLHKLKIYINCFNELLKIIITNTKLKLHNITIFFSFSAFIFQIVNNNTSLNIVSKGFKLKK